MINRTKKNFRLPVMEKKEKQEINYRKYKLRKKEQKSFSKYFSMFSSPEFHF